MAINLTKVLSQIETRHAAIDSNTDANEHTRLDAINDRINSMGGVLTYRSTGHLPEMVDSGYVGTIAYVTVDNVFGDSSGAFYMGTFKDSNWVRIATLQDSDEATIPDPANAVSVTSSYQGETASYHGGSLTPTNGVTNAEPGYEKFSFTSDGNSTDVADLQAAQYAMSAGRSATNGYFFQGTPNSFAFTNSIEYFPFSSEGNTTASPYTLATSRRQTAHTSIGPPSLDYVYSVGGESPPNSASNAIEKFAAANDGNATDVGDLVSGVRYTGGGASSGISGYQSGGYLSPGVTPAYTDTIQKWPFATDANATDVGNLTLIVYGGAGASGAEDGYFAGGITPGNPYDKQIQKWPFSTDADATEIGDLLAPRHHSGGSTSTTHGYSFSGQSTPSSTQTNVIEKWSLTTDGNSTDVGDALEVGYYRSGGAYT